MRLFIYIFSVFFAYNANAQMATFDAFNAKMQTLNQLELVKETKESLEQTKLMVDDLKQAQQSYNAMINTANDYKSSFEKAKEFAKSAEALTKHLGSFTILKENGIELDLNDFATSNDYVDSLYTTPKESKSLASYGKKLRNYETNEYAKTAVARATEVIHEEADNAQTLEDLTAKYQASKTQAQKSEATNKILLEIFRQMQVMTHLQAQMNKVIIAKHTKALDKPELNKWAEEDTISHIVNGGSHSAFKADKEDEAILDKMGIN